jgi:hypothetical protein
MNHRKIDTTIVRGDNLRVYVKVQDEAGSPVAISAAQTIKFEVAPAFGEASVITKSLNNGIVLSAADEFYYDLTQANTENLTPGRYRQEAQVITSSGLRYTIFQGTLRILNHVINGG